MGEETLSAQMIETWRIHNRIQTFFLNGVAPEALKDALDGKGRSVADHFAHMHNVRLMWLKASAPELLEGLAKIEKDDKADQETLTRSLEASGEAVAALLAKGLAEGKIKSFKPYPAAFLGYLISHESYHAGKIDLILRQAGHAVTDKIHYGMWEWGAR